MAIWSKEVFAKNLKMYMESKGKNQKELAEIVGVSAPTMNEWLKAKKYPRIDKIEILANYFGILKSDLIEEKSEEQREIQKNNDIITDVNVLGKVAAGLPISAIENIIDTEPISKEMAEKGTYFGLKIKGDSMLPRFLDGDTVIVKQQPFAESGDVVIALIDNEAVCKRIKKYRDGIELISNNPSYDAMFFTNAEIKNKPVTIIGKVVELRAKF